MLFFKKLAFIRYNYVGRFFFSLKKRQKIASVFNKLRLGFKPYVAPALSSAAISVVLLLKGEWHCSSTYLGGIFMGGKNRFGGEVEIERLALPEALMERIRETMAYLATIEP